MFKLTHFWKCLEINKSSLQHLLVSYLHKPKKKEKKCSGTIQCFESKRKYYPLGYKIIFCGHVHSAGGSTAQAFALATSSLATSAAILLFDQS